MKSLDLIVSTLLWDSSKLLVVQQSPFIIIGKLYSPVDLGTATEALPFCRLSQPQGDLPSPPCHLSKAC